MLAFIAGIVGVVWSPVFFPIGFLFALPALSLLLWRCSKVAAVFVLGMAWGGLATHQVIVDRWPADASGEIHLVEGVVVGLPTWTEDTLRFDLVVLDNGLYPKRIRVYWYRAKAYVVPGQHWEFSLRLRAPAGRLNFSGFNYEQYLIGQGIGGIGTVSVGEAGSEPQLLGKRNSPGALLDQRRMILAEKIQANTTNLELAALKRALLVGDRAGLSDQTRKLLQETGTAHLLAISGLHVGMAAGFGGALGMGLWGLLSGLGWKIPRRKVILISGWVCGLMYTGLAGFSLPTQRALIMLTVAVMALIWRRRLIPIDGLLVAAFLVVAIDPLAVLSSGFWLSFMAVLFLIWGFAWRSGRPKRFVAVRGLVGAQWILSIGLLPLSLAVFGQWSPIAFVANLMAIPWVSVLVLPGLLVSSVGQELGLRVSFVEQTVDWALSVLLWGLRYAHDLWPVLFSVGEVSALAMCLAVVGAFWVLAPRGWPWRSLGIVLFLPMAIPQQPAQSREDLNLELVDVGSGLAVAIEVGAYRLLYDLGPSVGEDKALIQDRLEQWGRSTPSTQPVIHDLVISHAHQGHVGGLLPIFRSTRIHTIRYPNSMDMGAIDVGSMGIPCHRGQVWSVGSWDFQFVHPGPRLPDLGGNSSCVLWIHGKHHGLLLNGGLDRAGEAHVALMNPGLGADVLVIGQSGHRQTTSKSWLDLVDPDLALISVGSNDRFDRPDPEVVARMDQMGIHVLQTGQCGAIQIQFSADQKTRKIQTARSARRRFWMDVSNCQ